jgi:hypothetical protein
MQEKSKGPMSLLTLLAITIKIENDQPIKNYTPAIGFEAPQNQLLGLNLVLVTPIRRFFYQKLLSKEKRETSIKCT